MNTNNQLQIRNSTVENSVCRKFRHTANNGKLNENNAELGRS